MDFSTYYSDTFNVRVELSHFGKDGEVQEFFFIFKPSEPGDLIHQLDTIKEAYLHALDIYQVPLETAIFKRFYIRDICNQIDRVKGHDLVVESSPISGSAHSFIGQSPLPNSKVMLWVYHVLDSGEKTKKVSEDSRFILDRNGIKHLLITGLSNPKPLSPYNQLTSIFNQLEACLSNKLKNRLIRTWIYVRDIERHYGEIVAARKDFLYSLGLSADTHFFASTGIEGKSGNRKALVSMDAYAIMGINPKQIRFLNAPTYLNPPHEYGVTFERGTQIEYGDRYHVFISGTASIDNKGKILHDNDLPNQIKRTFDNIMALLSDAGARKDDIAYATIYLKNGSDYEIVIKYMKKHFRNLPYILVLASICRPGWVIEVECMAIVPNKSNMFLSF